MIGGIAQTDWKHKWLVNGLVGAGLLIILTGMTFPFIADWAPRFARFVSDIATNPATWFAAVVLLIAVDIFVRSRRPRGKSSTSDLEQFYQDLQKIRGSQGEANVALSGMIGRVEDKVDKIAMNVQADVQGIRQSLKEVGEKSNEQHRLVGEGQMRLVRALRARYALDTVTPFVVEASNLGARLFTADQSIYPDDSTWLADYNKWKDALGVVDTMVHHWQKEHRRFLDVGAHEIERVRDMPPPNVISERTITQFKRLCLVNERFQESREGVLNYFRQEGAV